MSKEKDNKTSKDINDAAGAKPTALSDADLDKVAGGMMPTYGSTNGAIIGAFANTNYTIKPR